MVDFKYSKQTREMMVERGISHKEVRNAIEKGSKRRQDGKIVASYSYITVVYKKRKEVCYVITVMVRW